MMRLIRSVISNLATVLLALLLAIFIWATAIRSNDPVEVRTLEIDVDRIGEPANAQVVGQIPNSILLTLQGPTSALDEIRPGDFRGVVDLSNLPFGDSTVEIQVQGGHERVEQISKFPATTDIRLEQIITSEIPVVLDIRGEVARGHRAGEPLVEPAVIRVTGIASRVDTLSEARVTVFLDSAREDIVVTRRPIFYDEQGNVASVVGLNVNPSEVQVLISITELAGFAEKPITVDWIGEPAAGYRLLNVTAEPSSVQVTGSPSQLENLRIQTETIDVTGLTQSETRQVQLDLPNGINLVEPTPIFVTVEIEPILTSDVVQREVEIRALGAGLSAILDPEEVRVFLFGPLPILESLEEDDVRVIVDLLGLEIGTYNLEPIVTVTINEIEIRSTQPAVISVVITETVTPTNGITGTSAVTTTSMLVIPDNDPNTVGNCTESSRAGPCGPARPEWRFGLLPRRDEII
jgi:YbbR domain-containing protein